MFKQKCYGYSLK